MEAMEQERKAGATKKEKEQGQGQETKVEETGMVGAEAKAEATRAITRAREAFVRLSPRIRKTGERALMRIREKPALSALVAGGAAVGLAAAIGAAEVAVGFAGAYAVYRLARGGGDKARTTPETRGEKSHDVAAE